MSIRPIVKIPNPILTQECEKVSLHKTLAGTAGGKRLDDETNQLVQDLLDTVRSAKNPEAAGLAAPQIGISKRVCVVRKFMATHDGHEAAENYVLINPKIYSTSKETQQGWEGCMSIPDTYGQVERFKKVKVKALNEKGEEIRITATGFFARVIQHEIDHLDGILFTAKVIGNIMSEAEFDTVVG